MASKIESAINSNNISIDGYKERTFDEIRSEIINDINVIMPDMYILPNGLVDNLINVSSVILKQQEGLIKYLFNGISYPSTSDVFFDLVSNDYNLSRHPDAKSTCDIKITGKSGYIVNSGTQFSNESGTVIFYSTTSGIINSVGECILTCISDSLQEDIDKILLKDIKKLVVPDNNITAIENITIPTNSRDVESIENFKKRVQERVRNIVQGSPEGLLSALKDLPDVNPLLVSINLDNQEINRVVYNGIEAIVGGGDIYDISKLLLEYCGLNSKLLISNPSNNEATRTITTEVKFDDSTVEVKFTRPKILNFELTIKPKFQGLNITSEQLQSAISDSIVSVFNNLPISQKVNKTLIRETFMDIIEKECGFNFSNIIDVDYEYKIDGKPGSFDPNGFITEKLPDTWLKIVNLTISIQN